MTGLRAVIKPLPILCRGGLGIPWDPDGHKLTCWLTPFFSGQSLLLWFFHFWLILAIEVDKPLALIWRASTFFTSRALLVPRYISKRQRVKIEESTEKVTGKYKKDTYTVWIKHLVFLIHPSAQDCKHSILYPWFNQGDCLEWSFIDRKSVV